MPENSPFPPFQYHKVATGWAGERYSDVQQNFSPMRASTPDVLIEQPEYTTEQLPFPTQATSFAGTDQLPLPMSKKSLREDRRLSLPGQTSPAGAPKQFKVDTGPIYDIPTTQSLIAALQSTMTTGATRPPVVIPGTRARKKSPARTEPAKHLHPYLRYGIVVGAIVLVIILTLLSLTPLGSGQSGFHLFGDVIDWVHAQQQNWIIAAHLANPGSATQANSPAVGMPQNITLPQSQYVAIARQDAIAVGINPDYFVKQIYIESGFNPNAASGAGAVGIAQFEPGTAATLGINPYDPVSSLMGAAKLMASYSNQYGGDYAKALAAYNAGSGTVDYAVKVGGGNWMNYLPFETRQYIYKIMGV